MLSWVWLHCAIVWCPAGIRAWSARVCSIRRRRRWHFSASWSTPSSVRWRHAGSMQRTWRRSRNCLSAWKLYRRQDRATGVWFCVAAASAAISQQYSINVNQCVVRRASDCRSRPGRVVRRRAINALARFSGGTDVFYHLHRVRPVRRQLGRNITARLVTLVLSRLDYCNAVLVGLPASTLAQFQRVLHAAALTVLDLKPHDPCDSSSWELHWLPVAERIQYKLSLLVHKSLPGHKLEYISDLLTSVANIPSRSILRASSCGNLVVPRTRRRIGDRAFSVAAPRAWNRPPDGAETTAIDRLVS